MEKLLFVILVIVEIALAAFTLLKQATKKEWVRNRLAANCIELLLFISMTLLPGIDFSFRFKGLLFLLIIRLIISGIRFLLQHNKAEGNKKPAGLIAGSAGMCILLLISLVPAFMFRDYNGKETSGSFDVAMRHVILIDQSREETFESDGSKREVPIYFYYPSNASAGETFPLVVFSHGAFGYYQSNTSTYMELASNGYIVVSMEHPYHSIFTTDTAGKTIIADMQFLNDAMNIGGGLNTTEEHFAITNAWMNLRTADMHFAIDTIKAACEQNALPSGIWIPSRAEKEPMPTESEILDILHHINCDKIGVMGHSMGGATSVTVGRERDDIDAVIDLDGTMLGEEKGYENGAYILNEEPYPIPLLSFDNESHYTDGMKEGSYYVNNVIVANGLCAQHSYIKNAEHMNFTDLPLFSPKLASMVGGTGTIDADHCIGIVNDVVLQFMNSNLKGDGSYRVNEYYE